MLRITGSFVIEAIYRYMGVIDFVHYIHRERLAKTLVLNRAVAIYRQSI